MAMEDTSGLPLHREYKLTHYRQKYDWDCGLSCILMVVTAASRQFFLKHFVKICEEEGFNQNTWTIDLCYILKKFNVSHVYFTKTIGVDPNYTDHSYYSRILSRDQNRVNERFLEAESKGIHVDQRTVTFDAIIRHLSHHGPVILLTNAALLSCDICKNNQMKEYPIDVYSGHYIVVSGYDLLQKRVLYRNPAKEDHVCVSSIEKMDQARRAYGTDEDIIFIYFQSR